jgi:fatty acid CoA ligase FadD9
VPPTETSLDARRQRRVAELYATDQQVRDARPRPAVTAAMRAPGLPLARVIATIVEGYADRPALGERATELVTDPATGRTSVRLLPRFDTISYADLWARAGAIASEFHQDPQAPLRPGERVCVLGFTGADYTAIELACVRAGAVSVPLQAGASAELLTAILAETGPRVLATTVDLLPAAVECGLASASLRRLVVFDYQPEADEQRARFEAAGRRLAASGRIRLDSLGAVLARGAALPPVPPAGEPDGTRLATLVYTSGSSGTPKGAMYPERLVAMGWRAGFWPRMDDLPVISFNCLPMSHVSARGTLAGTLATGGTCYFTATSDLSTLFEDIALVRPTALRLVPRLCDMLLQRYHSERDRRPAGDQAAVDEEVRRELREHVLGGRLAWIGTGSAPLSAEMSAFVESVADLPVHDGYGSTETGRVLVDGKVARPPVQDYKLVDVPELGYFRTDSPYPRGELLVRTAAIISGYYQRPDLTAEMFDADGYYRTGDIMAETGPDELVYVDRRSNVLKLSQGEFVAVARLEALFATSPPVQQIFVYGSSERAFLLAVVVPTPEAAARASDTGLRAMVIDSLRQTARDAGLHSYEIPRDVLVETEPFSVDNGLLSEVRKLLRPQLRARYGDRLERLYTELAAREDDELGALRRAGRDQPVFDAAARAASALLGCAGNAVSPEAHFTDLGGDSLSALAFSTLLGEIFEVEVPVAVITSPATDLRRLVSHIETALRPGASRPTFATVHGSGATSVRSTDLTLDRFVDPGTLAAAGALPRPGGPARTVLLTGATGYLGRFLCLEWLERLAPRDGTLICLVRGDTADGARRRLTAAFDTGDPDLLQRFEGLAARHLRIVAGDVSEPCLGLAEPVWHQLADSVDLVVHPAALVNHLLPYEQLFGPNVVGTAELIRLALTGRVKRFTYVSTVGVIATQVSSSAEDADIRVVSPVRDPERGYAAGYATSKWAGEVLLREAHDLAGLPVAVFRSDLILAHSRYAGQVNVPDVLTRLLLSLITTGLAPRTFYPADGPGRGRAGAGFGGLPVDFLAAAVTALGEGTEAGYQTFNALSPDDVVSLDVLVDWLTDAGCPIVRIDDYGEWFTRFEAAVRALPEKRRKYSVLPLLPAFRSSGQAVGRAGYRTDRFRAAVHAAQAAEPGSAEGIPPLSAALVRKYVTDLRALDLI